MSRNLVEIVRLPHEVGAPTALEVLREAMERRGESLDLLPREWLELHPDDHARRWVAEQASRTPAIASAS